MEETEQIELDAMQHKAVIESIKHGLLVLTGGPGTGKNDHHQYDDPLF